MARAYEGGPRLASLRIENYRSVRKLGLELGQITVLTGPNGVGKSAILSALSLLSASATGDLARNLANEGGMASALWAGARRKGPVRMRLAAEIDGLDYAIDLGLPRPTDAALALDPIVKEETVRLTRGRRAAMLMSRKGPLMSVRDGAGAMAPVNTSLWLFETGLSRIADSEQAPELGRLAAALAAVRVYDPGRVDAESPLRRPTPLIATPCMAPDGADWAAALYSRLHLADGWADRARAPAHRAIAAAFDGAEPAFFEDGPALEGGLSSPEFPRPFRARELSDGTLRYLALVAALTPLRPPSVIVLNEPEASLNPRMIPALAELIGAASGDAQIILATHERRLADLLDVEHGAMRIDLAKRDGETQIVEAQTP